MSKRGFGRGAWCLMGDFNAIKNQCERRGAISQENKSEILGFSQFIEDMELIDIPTYGRKFSWFKSDGSVMSRLDRFLVSEEWLHSWSASSQWILDRDFSDHCPIILKTVCSNWGPRPFRFNNFWLQHPGFGDMVKNFWEGIEVEGWAAFVLKEKLKNLKVELVRWNREVFGHLDTKIAGLGDEIRLLDLKAEASGIDETEFCIRKSLLNELWEKTIMKESLLVQKSRSRWLKEGDENSGFFHACINSRRRVNHIQALQNNSVWLIEVEEVKQEILNHFTNQFSETTWERPILEGVQFNQLNEEDNNILADQFSEEEIKEAVWDCEGDKSPGPDGFNFTFLKNFWDCINSEVYRFVKEFYANSKLPKGIIGSFVILIPKKECAHSINDFRPISLVGCLYKILAKVLSKRLKMVLPKVISRTQSAFLENRQILDGVVVVNEVLDYAKRKKKSCLVCKIDFEKAYDYMRWPFLDYMLQRLGFCARWRKWIDVCISG